MVRKEVNTVKNPINNWTLVLIMCAWLGLAPFFPEPHIWGKIKWIAGGANGMQLIDWEILFCMVSLGYYWADLFSSNSNPGQ